MIFTKHNNSPLERGRRSPMDEGALATGCVKKTDNKPEGFTLIELLVAVAIFSMVVVVSVNIFIRVSRAQQEVQTWQGLQSEAQFIIDTIASDLKKAKFGHMCGAFYYVGDCWGNDPGISFVVDYGANLLSGTDDYYFYYHSSGGVLYKSIFDQSSNSVLYEAPLNSINNIYIDDFRVVAVDSSDPRHHGSLATVFLTAHTNIGDKQKNITLQTSVMGKP